jgi:hypothetical protein
MIASPHFAQMRLVKWLMSSRFASEARAVFESSPFFGIDSRPLSPIFCLFNCLSELYTNQWPMPNQAYSHCVGLQYTIEIICCPIDKTTDAQESFRSQFPKKCFVTHFVTFLKRSINILQLKCDSDSMSLQYVRRVI